MQLWRCRALVRADGIWTSPRNMHVPANCTTTTFRARKAANFTHSLCKLLFLESSRLSIQLQHPILSKKAEEDIAGSTSHTSLSSRRRVQLIGVSKANYQMCSKDFATSSGMSVVALRFLAAPQPSVRAEVTHSSASSIKAVSTSSDSPLSGPNAALAIRLMLCTHSDNQSMPCGRSRTAH